MVCVAGPHEYSEMSRNMFEGFREEMGVKCTGDKRCGVIYLVTFNGFASVSVRQCATTARVHTGPCMDAVHLRKLA
jgi:hypothetical protein